MSAYNTKEKFKSITQQLRNLYDNVDHPIFFQWDIPVYFSACTEINRKLAHSPLRHFQIIWRGFWPMPWTLFVQEISDCGPFFWRGMNFDSISHPGTLIAVPWISFVLDCEIHDLLTLRPQQILPFFWIWWTFYIL